jgi:DNA-binding winged helix-turn-helix (wHTH) protein
MSQLSRYLEVTHPDGTEQTVPLQDTVIKIGRAKGNDIVLQDDNVSNWHCSIVPPSKKISEEASEEGYWSVRDGFYKDGSHKHSTNGTFLKRNTETIDIRTLSNCKEFLGGDDEIQIQNWRIIFKDPFKTKNCNNNTTAPKALTDGFVFCISQYKLYLVKNGNREHIYVRSKLAELLACLAIQNLEHGKPVVCTYEQMARFIWKDVPSGVNGVQGAPDIQGLARELRKVIGADGLETISNKGYILHIHVEA